MLGLGLGSMFGLIYRLSIGASVARANVMESPKQVDTPCDSDYPLRWLNDLIQDFLMAR